MPEFMHVPNALRQLYEIPTHKGVEIERWIYANPTRAPAKSSSMVLPQLSLHTSGGPILEIHPYGRLAVSRVYGSVTATQVLDETVLGTGSYEYPWVRYYARRFGDTTVPLTLTSTPTATSVSITPVEFDELDEIIDGWKEVTLRFDNAPTLGGALGLFSNWTWSATNELQGSRWEVLGVSAPALSGTPGNLLNKVPSPNQLSLATYGAPVSGGVVDLDWVPGISPLVSGSTDDPTSDATLIFAQDLPMVTGFSVSVEDQVITGIGLNCGVDPCCVPSEIQYNWLTWPLPANTSFAVDTFTRTEVGTWGDADSGQTWLPTSSSDVTFSVDGSQGLVETTNANNRGSTVATPGSNQDVQVTLSADVNPVSTQIRGGLILRRQSDNSNYYFVRLDLASTGVVTLEIGTTIAGTNSVIASVVVPNLSVSPNAGRTVRARIDNTRIQAKVWAATQTEPEWQLEVTDSTFTTGERAGVFFRDLGGHATVVWAFDNFTVNPPDFGSYELQRSDQLGDWETIMLATSPAVTAFSDFEARVGIESLYRIRAVDVYNFPGLWSDTVASTIPEPGVTIGCPDGHLLIFTSNEEQDGSLNLAYSSVWEDRVTEDFVFPESSFVQLQAMYDRDFFTAFRPTERGGERFSRTVLVQAAAIAPETLADFTSLRDMAWANTSYTCVRDEDGNRWFATVMVPSGRVVHHRKLYLAPVEIIEVTETPSQVNP